MVSLLGYVDAIRGPNPLAQVGGLALDFVARMVPSPVGMFLVLRQSRDYSLVTVKADPILTSDADQIGRDFLTATEGKDPIGDLTRDHHRTNLFGSNQIESVPSFTGSPLEREFIPEYEFGPLLILDIWDEGSEQHCIIFLARSIGEPEFSDREKGFLRHAAPLLTQSYRCAISMGGIVAPSPGSLASGLTSRELEIALLAANGARNGEIAEHLNIASGTVKCHMHSVYAKLGMSSRVQLAIALGVAN